LLLALLAPAGMTSTDPYREARQIYDRGDWPALAQYTERALTQLPGDSPLAVKLRVLRAAASFQTDRKLAAESLAGAAHARALLVIRIAGLPFTLPLFVARLVPISIALAGRLRHGLPHRLLHLLQLLGILRRPLHLLEHLGHLLLRVGHLLAVLSAAVLRRLLHRLGHLLRRLGHAVGLRLGVGALLRLLHGLLHLLNLLLVHSRLLHLLGKLLLELLHLLLRLFILRILGRLLHGLPAQVNLIPLNPTAGYAGTPTRSEAVRQFQKILADEFKLPSTVRQRRGIDIAAGCGQLASAT